MIAKVLNFFARPKLGETETQNLAFQQYQGYGLADVNGNGGHVYARSLMATSFVNLAPGPTLKLNNLAVTGNVNQTLDLQSLTNDKLQSI